MFEINRELNAKESFSILLNDTILFEDTYFEIEKTYTMHSNLSMRLSFSLVRVNFNKLLYKTKIIERFFVLVHEGCNDDSWLIFQKY